jgi:pimeloyl-ACP methyl ester carboxylesterase
MDVHGDGAPLVLIHGVGANRAIWRRVTPLLAADRLVAAPDLPGLGACPPAGRGFALDAVADTLADALRRELPLPFDLLGNSLGGAVALVVAARHPELVRRLVLAAPAGLAPHRGPIPALAGRAGSTLSAVRRRAGPPLAGSAVARRLLLLGVVADPAGMPADDARLMLRGSEGSQRIGEAIAAVVRADLRPRLAELEMPLAFLWGARDRVIPLRTLRVPGVRLEVISGAGHVPHMECPQEFAAAVDRLLAAITVP